MKKLKKKTDVKITKKYDKDSLKITFYFTETNNEKNNDDKNDNKVNKNNEINNNNNNCKIIFEIIKKNCFLIQNKILLYY